MQDEQSAGGLSELLTASHTRLLIALGHVEFLCAAAPFCDPLTTLIRDELAATRSLIEAASDVAQRITELASSFSTDERRRP